MDSYAGEAMTPARRKSDSKVQHTSRAVLALVYVTFASAFALMGLCAFWWFYPYQVISVDNAKMTAPVVYQGQTTTYTDDYKKLLDIPSEATRAFVDGIVYDAGSYETNLPVGSGHIIRPVTIPDTLPPGRYHLQITLRYKVNPLKTVIYQFSTDEFTVKANPANPDAAGDVKLKTD
jgi:hypothetical protein